MPIVWSQFSTRLAAQRGNRHSVPSFMSLPHPPWSPQPAARRGRGRGGAGRQGGQVRPAPGPSPPCRLLLSVVVVATCCSPPTATAPAVGDSGPPLRRKPVPQRTLPRGSLPGYRSLGTAAPASQTSRSSGAPRQPSQQQPQRQCRRWPGQPRRLVLHQGQRQHDTTK